MFDLPVFESGWIEAMAAVWFALMMAKLMKQQMVVLTTALCLAILMDSWVGVFVAPLLCMTLYPIDVAKKVG